MKAFVGSLALLFALVLAGASAADRMHAERRLSAAVETAPSGHYPIQTRGVRVHFENRGEAYGFNSGELVQQLTSSALMQAEVNAQLERMRGFGINEIAFELRSVGDVQDNQPPPDCRLAASLGAHWPDPLPSEVSGLRMLLGFVRAHGMRLALHLTNTHHEAPWELQERWLGPLLGVVRDDETVDFVTFDGDVSIGWQGQCGGQSEAALWMGAGSATGRYVANAIRYGTALGISPNRLTAEAVTPCPCAEQPVDVMKQIFDELRVPESDRTYALSMYEQRRPMHQTAEAALRRALVIIGKSPGDANGPRVLLSEFGNEIPVPSDWSSSEAMESFGVLMREFDLDGGNYWLWVEMNDLYELQGLTEAVKRRGVAWRYNPVARELRDLYGFHVESIPGGSFEIGWRDTWSLAGKGTARRVPFGRASLLPWRGASALELRGRPRILATSAPIRVSGGRAYTTTGDFRVRERGSTVAFRYLGCGGEPLGEQVFQLAKTDGSQPFPFRYTTPAESCFVRIRIAAVGRPLQVDNLR